MTLLLHHEIISDGLKALTCPIKTTYMAEIPVIQNVNKRASLRHMACQADK